MKGKKGKENLNLEINFLTFVRELKCNLMPQGDIALIFFYKLLMQFKKSAYSQYIACIVLSKALTKNTVVLNSEDKYKLRKYFKLINLLN